MTRTNVRYTCPGGGGTEVTLLTWLNTGEFYALACAFLWAYGVILFKRSGEFLAPVVLNAFKSLVGLLLFLITGLLAGFPLFPDQVTEKEWFITLASGAIGVGLADTFFFRALNIIGAGKIAIVDCLYSPCVVLCSFIYLGEPMPLTLFVAVLLMVAAIILGFSGRHVPSFVPHHETPHNGSRSISKTISTRKWIIGAVYAVAAIMLTAAAIVAVKPILQHHSAWWVATVRLFGGVVLIGAYVIVTQHRTLIMPALARKRTWRIALPAALVGTYLGFLLWTLGMKHTYTTVASVLNQTSNILVLPLARLMLQEPLGPRQWAAVFLGFAGAVIVML